MNVLSQIIVLFLMLFTGAVIRKKNIITDTGVFEMSRMVLYVTLPALIIKAMQFEFTAERMMHGIKMPIIAVLLYIFCIAASYVFVYLLGVKGKTADIFQMCIIFPNVGFMGYPVIMSVYGEEGVFYTALFNMFFDLLLWTVGVKILSRSTEGDQEKKHILKTFLNPGTIAVMIGFTLFIFSIPLPKVIEDTLTYLSAATVPIAMISVGALLSKSNLKDILKNRSLIGMALFKMILLPSMIWLLLRGFELSGYFLAIPLIIMAMPSAANVAMFASKQRSDDVLASQGIFLTTVLSLITIPLIVNWVR